MKEALDAALAGQATIVIALDVTAVAEMRAAAQSAEVVLLLIDESVPKLDAAMLIAALGPLAVELAPSKRIVALDVAAGADQEDVIAAARYLVGAASTTGQVLRITQR